MTQVEQVNGVTITPNSRLSVLKSVIRTNELNVETRGVDAMWYIPSAQNDNALTGNST